MKLFSIVLFAIIISGCSQFTVNATMCEELMKDPNTQNIPEECRVYKEEDADKSTYPKDKRPIEVDQEFQIGK
ncbi:hypothetical protein [Sulfurimonas sp. HSL3-7]|uniref:hypothetical protein n=1 Tax=Sulfonitrofixus jiaomeiensis TaxID=3131938 RepID=UPI0031F91A49